jgi:CBS domain-containing protein
MQVRDLLKGKKVDRIFTVRPDDTIADAASVLKEHKIGALPVCQADGKLVGVISERDVLRGLVENGAAVLSLRVSELMTRNVIVCRPADTVREAMAMMSRSHVRHLPVMEEEHLRGIISQRDVMKAQLEQTQLEVNVLRDYAMVKG